MTSSPIGVGVIAGLWLAILYLQRCVERVREARWRQFRAPSFVNPPPASGEKEQIDGTRCDNR